jgi:hypothetical protein
LDNLDIVLTDKERHIRNMDYHGIQLNGYEYFSKNNSFWKVKVGDKYINSVKIYDEEYFKVAKEWQRRFA